MQHNESVTSYPPHIKDFVSGLYLLGPTVVPHDEDGANIQIPTADKSEQEDIEGSGRVRRSSLASVVSQETGSGLPYSDIMYPLYQDFYAVCLELESRQAKVYHPLWKADISRDSDPHKLKISRAAYAFAWVCLWYGIYPQCDSV